MGRIPDDLVEQIRDAADLLEIVQESVELKRTGSDWRGACPFHGGTGRNFAVIPRKNIYHCFVCHASGDVFTWYRDRLGLDYPGAIREVARRVGITIPDTGRHSGPDPNEALYQAVDAAQSWYNRQLLESPQAERARNYLGERSFDLAAAAQLRLGYAPAGSEFLAAMRELGIGDTTLEDAGLVRRRDDGRLYPCFRDRLLFPLHDLQGRAVGFGGRIMGSGQPKYLNTPETVIFHKGEQLYNLHAARPGIRKAGYSILVEGYFDVQRLVLADTTGVVAAMGTGLTEAQALLLKRYAPEVILLYDSDGPGLKATFRAGDVLLQQGLRVLVATMPEGDDPDSLVLREGAAGLERLLHDAVDLLERKLQILELHGWFQDAGRSREALDRLLPTLRLTADQVTRELYITRVAERVRIPREVIAQEAQPLPARVQAPVVSRPVRYQRDPVVSASLRSSRTARVERLFLRILLSQVGWLARARDETAADDFTIPSYRAIFEALTGLADDAPVTDAFSQLTPELQEVWNNLMEDPLEEGFDVDRDYAGALDMFAENRLFPEIESEPDPVTRRKRWQALPPESQRRFQEYLRARRTSRSLTTTPHQEP